MPVKGIKDIKGVHQIKGIKDIKRAKDIEGVSDHEGLSQLQEALKEAGETLQRNLQSLLANLQTGVNRLHDEVGHSTVKISQSLKKVGDLPHHLEETLVHDAGEAEGKAIPKTTKHYMRNARIARVDPKVESFGNVRRTPRGPVVEEEREPLVEVFDEKDHVLVIVELPRVEEEHIRTQVNGDILTLCVANGGRKYSKEVVLPKESNTNTLTKKYKNGVLEIRMRKK